MSAMNIIGSIVFLVFAMIASDRSNAQDPRYLVQVEIGTKRMFGSAEYQRNIALSKMLEVRRGSTGQFKVTLLDTASTTVLYPDRNNKVRYDSFGCIAVQSDGSFSFVATSRCSGPDYPTLMVTWVRNGVPLTYNSYLFHVID